MNAPKIVTAGAGSGKTFRIVDEVERLVAKEQVPVDRIGAVTFTDAAAAELQERIRERLVSTGLLDQAQRLDAAPIRTIHSFALSLLRENPTEAAVSPEPLILAEVESAALLFKAVTAIMQDPAHDARVRWLTTEYYEDQKFPPYKRAADFLGDHLKALCDHLRAMRAAPADLDETIAANRAEIEKVFGKPGDPKKLDAALRKAAEPARQFLQDYPEGRTKGDANVAPKLQRVVDAIFSDEPSLRRIADADGCKWSGAGKDLKPIAMGITAEVDCWLRHHPRSLEYVLRAAEELIRVAFAVLTRYQEAKERLSALDYEDMQARALELLERTIDGVPFAEYVAARLPHLVIDEFQDTSPLQFRIAESLRAHGTRTVYVGDPRQGIYGFRGADSRLMQALVQKNAGAVESLDKNWRSRPELVEFVNEVFAELFPKVGLDYTRLSPKGAYGPSAAPTVRKAMPSLEFVNAKRQAMLARVQQILTDETFEVLDRKTGTLRRVRAGDIAVLCATNAALDGWAKELDALGIRFTRELEGWSQSVEVQLARAALTALVNPMSSMDLAALLVSEVYGVTQPELQQLAAGGTAAVPPAQANRGTPRLFTQPRWLTGADEERAREFIASLRVSSASQAALWQLREDFRALDFELRNRPLPEFVQAVIERLRLEPIFAAKGGGAQSRANLVRLVEQARTFVAMHERSLEAVGATATTVENFLYYLDAVIAQAGDAQPEPIPSDEYAVTLATLHGAKGLEWPVVVLPDLGRDVSPRLARLEVVRPSDADDLLGPDLFALSRLRVLPDCIGETLRHDLAASNGGDEAARAEAARLVYVALTRAREHLVLGWKDEAESDSQQAMLEQLGGVSLGADAVAVGKKSWPATVLMDKAAPNAIDAAAEPGDREELRRFILEGVALAKPAAKSAFAIVAAPAQKLMLDTSPGELCHFIDSPEQWRLHRRGADAKYPVSDRQEAMRIAELPSGRSARGGKDVDPAALGRFVHLALELAKLDDGTEDVRSASLALRRRDAVDPFPLQEALEARLKGEPEAKALVAYCMAAVANVRKVVGDLGALEIAREVPFVLPFAGHRLIGVIDLAIRTQEGWHVFDHKTHPIAEAAIAKWAAFYRPQIDLYAIALEAVAKAKVVGRHLLFHTTGRWASYEADIDRTALEAALGEMATAIVSPPR